MGLDMYLRAKRHNSKYFSPEVAEAIRQAVPDAPPACDNLGTVEASFEVAYWRKANAIHEWFVRNVQNGTDDCREYLVNDEDLTKLRDICAQLLDSKDEKLAGELLPTADGFFFGTTEYGDWYWQNVAETKEKLTKLLSWYETNSDHWDFAYQSSW